MNPLSHLSCRLSFVLAMPLRRGASVLTFFVEFFLCSHGNPVSLCLQPAFPLQAAPSSHPYLLLISAGNKHSLSNPSSVALALSPVRPARQGIHCRGTEITGGGWWSWEISVLQKVGADDVLHFTAWEDTGSVDIGGWTGILATVEYLCVTLSQCLAPCFLSLGF